MKDKECVVNKQNVVVGVRHRKKGDINEQYSRGRYMLREYHEGDDNPFFMFALLGRDARYLVDCGGLRLTLKVLLASYMERRRQKSAWCDRGSSWQN